MSHGFITGLPLHVKETGASCETANSGLQNQAIIDIIRSIFLYTGLPDVSHFPDPDSRYSRKLFLRIPVRRMFADGLPDRTHGKAIV